MRSEETVSESADASSAQSTNEVVTYERENTALTTPPPKSPGFVFLSEEKQVPEKLYNLQEISLRRKEEFQSNIHDLELRVAGLFARMAEESMDRQNALQDVLTNDLYQPLQAGIADLQLGTDNDCLSATSSWIRLEGRLSALDTKMTHSVHVKIKDEVGEKLEDLLAKLQYQIQPDVKLELYKMNKREGSLFHRFEELVGSMVRRLLEERISRQAAIARTSHQIATIEDLDQQKGEIILEKIGKIRALLDEERAIRLAQDARIMQLIQQQEATMKEALMEVVGSDPDEAIN
jgi:RNAse (barnase) inhibitor barstar